MSTDDERGMTALNLDLQKTQIFMERWRRKTPLPTPPGPPPVAVAVAVSVGSTAVASPTPAPQTASSTASSIAERQLAVVPAAAEEVHPRPIGPAQLPHLRTDEESALRIAEIETKVTGLEIQVEKIQQQLKNVMDIMVRHDMQVLPSEAASMADSDFQVLPIEGAAWLERRGRRDH